MGVQRGFGAFTLALLAAGAVLSAQGGEKYAGRLSWVPITNAAQQKDVAGKGALSATLTGSKLAVSGTFEGLVAPATVARLHEGIAKGARGAAIADLTVSKGTSGTISGTVDLKPEYLESLKQGKVYVQLHSEKGQAPDGSNLWGWLSRQ